MLPLKSDIKVTAALWVEIADTVVGEEDIYRIR